MDEAIGYKRISETDQSNSLSMQETGIVNYCKNNSLHLKKVFTDNGRSAFTFNRPEWMALEKYLKANKSIKFLIVYHIDRFSRATLLDALLKLREIEERLKVKVLTVNDNVNQDSADLSTQLNRIMQLLFSNNEYNRIKQRVTDGIYQSLCRGRYCTKAPVGYLNTKLSKDDRKLHRNDALIVIDKKTAPLIKEVFSLYNSGLNVESIKSLLPGLKLTGNSAIQRILSNSIYAGIVKVPEYKGTPAFEVNGIHEAIVSKLEYYKAISRLNKKQAVTQPADEVWLRGVLRCRCGRTLTAGNSKGKSGKYYWYYKCNTHKEVNLSATKLHKEFLQLLDTLSFDESEVVATQKKLQEKIKHYQNNKGGMIMQLNIEHQKTAKKIKEITQKFLLTEHIDKDIFETTLNDLKTTLIDLEVKLVKAKTDTDSMHNIMNLLLPKLTKLSAVFKTFPLYRQHQFIKTLFPLSIWYDGVYRTPLLFELYSHKALILKEKGLLIIEQPSFDLGEIPLSTLYGNPIEQLESMMLLFVA